MLGGQHTAAAKAELLKENPGNSLFNQVFAEVYMGLTDRECLRLASRHNTNGHFIHKMNQRLCKLCYTTYRVKGRAMELQPLAR